eukprot:3446513-Rhodomonas_salina.4
MPYHDAHLPHPPAAWAGALPQTLPHGHIRECTCRHLTDKTSQAPLPAHTVCALMSFQGRGQGGRQEPRKIRTCGWAGKGRRHSRITASWAYRDGGRLAHEGTAGEETDQVWGFM